VFLKNNRSASNHAKFVSEAINDLLNNNLIVERKTEPNIVNPLSVSIQSSGKKRLILDLRHVNKFLWKERVSFEDWRVAIDIFKKGDFMCSFDLKSGYHHVNIFPDHTEYLSFAWRFQDGTTRYFSFLVLPFGLSTAPYIFTKFLRPLVKHWRSKGIFMVLYLDDGWIRGSSYEECKYASEEVKADLIAAGLVPNIDKSVWEPTQVIDWLGMIWDAKQGAIAVINRRVQNTLSCIEAVLQALPKVTARSLASLAGKIISLYPVVGPISQMKSRFIHYEIVKQWHWDKMFKIPSDSGIIDEIFFWKNNIVSLNNRLLFEYSLPQIVMHTDASGVGCGAQCGVLRFSQTWETQESGKSSTWRELKGVLLALEAFLPKIKEKAVKLFTDNRGVVAIVDKGSMNLELQNLSLDIYRLCKCNNISLEVQ
jgi:hypothetical protein